MKSFRTERIGELIRQEISDLLLRGLKDARVKTGMVSVTGVEVARDLYQAKVYVSIYGDPQVQASVMAGLASAAGYVRGEIAKRIRLRHTPEIIFEQDISLERGDRLMTLLQQIKKPEA